MTRYGTAARSGERRVSSAASRSTAVGTLHSSELLAAARAEALFASDVSAYSRPTPAQVTAAIQRAVRTYGGTRACAAEMAAAFGEHPETAAARMRWARLVVAHTYSPAAQIPRQRRPATTA